MSEKDLPAIVEQRRMASPFPTPQALAFHDGALWIGSRDLRRFYGMDVEKWTVFEEREAPGVPWGAVSAGDSLRLTVGEGADDDRYLRRYVVGEGFSPTDRLPCPDFTGSYLSYDGEFLYLSQWYKRRILRLDRSSNILRTFDVGAEICGHTFVDGMIYVLRGTEQGDEDWRIGRVDPRLEDPEVEDLAAIPFQCRSLGFDGNNFWSNHRSGDAVVCFALPG
jgi:hypothetical protein